MFSIYPKVFFLIFLSLTLYNIYLNNKITTQNWCGRNYFDLVSRRKTISVTNHTSSKTTLKDRYNILADLVPLNIGYKLSSRLQFNSQQIKILSFFIQLRKPLFSFINLCLNNNPIMKSNFIPFYSITLRT